ncbi:T9SS type A sorting domain-containing protein [Chryseobacterium sp.]|uniref:T9SS type A sorting domain-containing protein n=1 Tax=Chryseobacterium sp. TaxID=1871047 RepID=UPI00321AEDE0
MKKILLSLSLITAAFSFAQISLSEGFENETYPFTNDKFFRSKVLPACVGSYTLNKEFYKEEAASTVYSSNASNGGKLDISFKYKTHILLNGSVNGKMKVEYSVDGGQNYQTLETINLTSVISCTSWSGSLPQGTVPASADFKLRISGQWTAGDYWLLLDDFKLTQSPFLATADVNKKKTTVYPNPFKDVIYLDNADTVKSISISDLSGRKIKSVNTVSKEVQLSELKKGIYILTIENNDGSKNQTKIIKD